MTIKTKDFIPNATSEEEKKGGVGVRRVIPIGDKLSGDIYEVREGRAILWPDGTHRGSGVGAERTGVPVDPYLVRGDDPFAFPRFKHNLRKAENQDQEPNPIPTRWHRELLERQGVMGDRRTDREKMADAIEEIESADTIQDPDDLTLEDAKAKVEFALETEVADVGSEPAVDENDEELERLQGELGLDGDDDAENTDDEDDLDDESIPDEDSDEDLEGDLPSS